MREQSLSNQLTTIRIGSASRIEGWRASVGSLVAVEASRLNGAGVEAGRLALRGEPPVNAAVYADSASIVMVDEAAIAQSEQLAAIHNKESVGEQEPGSADAAHGEAAIGARPRATLSAAVIAA